MNHKHTAMTVKIIVVYDNLLQQISPLKSSCDAGLYSLMAFSGIAVTKLNTIFIMLHYSNILRSQPN